MLVLAFLNAAGLTLAISWSKVFSKFRSWITSNLRWRLVISNDPLKIGDVLTDTSMSHQGTLGQDVVVSDVNEDGMYKIEGDKYGRWMDKHFYTYQKVISLDPPKKIFNIINDLLACPFCLGFHITNLMLVLHWIDPMIMYWLGGLTGSIVCYAIYRKIFEQ